MIYDRPLKVYTLDGTPIKGEMKLRGSYFYALRTVSHRRYWESVQADSRVDKAVQIPGHADIIATQFVKLENKWWRIEEAQHTTDDDGLPATILALRRWDGDFRVARAT